jgi:hypothetical protein
MKTQENPDSRRGRLITRSVALLVVVSGILSLPAIAQAGPRAFSADPKRALFTRCGATNCVQTWYEIVTNVSETDHVLTSVQVTSENCDHCFYFDNSYGCAQFWPATYGPGGQCGVRLLFDPPSPGSFRGTLTIFYDEGQSLTVRLRGVVAS